jgi:hypothetical protein
MKAEKPGVEYYYSLRTTVSVRLMQHEGESLISRAQAKRLMNRFDRFLEVVLDFSGVDFIGQGFADEIFRVFANEHPATRLVPTHCTETVEKMIAHVRRNQHQLTRPKPMVEIGERPEETYEI